MEKNLFKIENLEFEYRLKNTNSEDIKAIDGMNLELLGGQFISIIGRNGSGKSTLAKLLNGLIIPTSGNVFVDDLDTKSKTDIWKIRQIAGMVFQNPENQIIGLVVEEDVAFGPENIGLPSAKIRERVDSALKMLGISEYAKHQPGMLSGGQKQMVAIAGILAMKPRCIILDEATAMIDPIGRKEIMRAVKRLNKEENITIIHITHHMDEACMADRVIVVDKGRVFLDGAPEEVFSDVEKIKAIGLDVPQIVELFYELNKKGIDLPLNIIDFEDSVELIRNRLGTKLY